ncbi:hypothetical protein BVF91_11545 [Thermoanaerobacterium sp. PSU-2]|uniref:GH25 family lysozyme n=1 Tax=Thermoanaerobacterium sp. PSU-2 TaxID=1930849 RepID=UPI000A14CD5C|nr:GH25 family lysozyme [Thermoanaerobacterium sp. PSU-2]ORX22467.1 hypothetical protein BVF91_11545 [Thermoanaerobacterium sp. PSU-2]
MKIIDISNHNPVQDATKVKNAGYAGVICKATEGKTYIDPTFQTNVAKLSQAGMLFGTYHFARPDNNQPEDEATNYYRQIASISTKLPPILDIEVNCNLGKDALTNWILRFIAAMKKLTGKDCIIYTYTSYLNSKLDYSKLQNYNFWIADYGSKEPTIPHIMWQYTDKENVPGIGICDCSIANDDLSIRKGGESVDWIKQLQQELNQVLGLNLAVDGIIGPATTSAIKLFQTKAGLTADGVYGPATADALAKALQNLNKLAQNTQTAPQIKKTLLKTLTIKIYSDGTYEIN